MLVVTLCDKKYIKQAELMIKSSQAEMVYFLALDNETYDYFKNYLNVVCLKYEDVISKKLTRHRDTHKWDEHCWALASYFTAYVRKITDDDLLYVDADIYFYRPIASIWFGASIGIVEHRFKRYDPNRNVGHYNVGIVYFANDEPGTECLNRWANLVLNDENEYYHQYGTCGDQKYLELFPIWYPDDWEVIDVGHAAPWNTTTQNLNDGIITFRGTAQPLTYFHFSHFSIRDGGYVTQRNGEWFPERTEWAKELYDQYYQLNKEE